MLHYKGLNPSDQGQPERADKCLKRLSGLPKQLNKAIARPLASQQNADRIALTGFTSNNNWSSSEYSSTNAWNLYFNNGNQNNNNKTNNNYVRPIRSSSDTFVNTGAAKLRLFLQSTFTSAMTQIKPGGITIKRDAIPPPGTEVPIYQPFA